MTRGGRAGITNAHLAELLAREADQAQGHVALALKRAARSAFLWPEEAAELARAGRSLTDLDSVGPFIARQMLAWIEQPPKATRCAEERRDFLTLAEARRILARQPDWTSRYRGDLQMHSQWSDGSSSIAEMAQAAQARGYEYIAITDHTKGLKIAGGINEKELREQEREIEQLNQSLPKFRVLKSAEMNLNPSGQGDMDSAALARLDLVVGSFHSSLRGTGDQTARYLAALNNPDVQILGHPRGRVYNYRLGLKADWRRVFAEAARLDKAIELDAYVDRQDLNVELLKLAREEGVRISIDTDAHSPAQLGFVELGLAAALRAGIEPRRIISFLSVEKLVGWSASLRVRTAAAPGRLRKVAKP